MQSLWRPAPSTMMYVCSFMIRWCRVMIDSNLWLCIIARDVMIYVLLWRCSSGGGGSLPPSITMSTNINTASMNGTTVFTLSWNLIIMMCCFCAHITSQIDRPQPRLPPIGRALKIVDMCSFH